MGWDRRAPWLGNDLIVYEGNANQEGVVWKPADEPQRFTLTFKGFGRGRSAAYANCATDLGGNVVLHLVELEPLIKRGLFNPRGQVSGLWVVKKHGQNFSLALAPEKN